MQTETIADDQQVSVTFNPEDSTGNPSTNYQSGIWSASPSGIVSITVTSGNQLSANITAEAPGTATVTFTGQSAPTGSSPYSASFTMVVTGGPAAGGTFSFGTPTNQ